MIPYNRKMKLRAVKAALIDYLKENFTPQEVQEWLYDEFGIKPGRNDWKGLERAILKSNEITPQDIVVFLRERGIVPEEGAWDANPRYAMRGPGKN